MIAIPVGSKQRRDRQEFIHWELTDEAQLEGSPRTRSCPRASDLADNKYFQDEPRYITTAKAVGIGQTPCAFHFNDMVNSDSSPWIQMLQTAIFDGDVDGAIATAQGSHAGHRRRVIAGCRPGRGGPCCRRRLHLALTCERADGAEQRSGTCHELGQQPLCRLSLHPAGAALRRCLRLLPVGQLV